jgi:hypothetical protein
MIIVPATTTKTEAITDREGTKVTEQNQIYEPTTTGTRTKVMDNATTATLRIGTKSMRIESKTLGTVTAIPETETTTLETIAIQERTTTDLNLLSEVEKILQ